MDWQTQLRAHRLWLDAAGGDLRTVEKAIIAATRANDGRPPNFQSVLKQIQAAKSPSADRLATA